MAGEFDLEGVVPWGRIAEEYEAIFRLEDLDDSAAILDCGGGPSSFTAEWTARGRRVVAVDPLYALDGAQIAKRFEETCPAMLDGMHAASHRFRWDRFASPEEVVETRRKALRAFLGDYDAGRRERRYIQGALPKLPFEDATFDLALSSHLLFLYPKDLDFDFHLEATQEMLRVATELRIHPLLDIEGQPSPHREGVAAALSNRGFQVDTPKTRYEFQKGATRYLRASRA